MQASDIDFDLYRKWIKALRSGKYIQGEKRLRQVGPKGLEYCCLGVVCNISKTSKWSDKNNSCETSFRYGDSDLVSPPESLLGKLGLNSDLSGESPSYSTQNFWEMNDTDHLTFAEIADLIEITLVEAFGYKP